MPKVAVKVPAKRGRKPGQKVNRTAVAYSVAAAIEILDNGTAAQKADLAKRYPFFTTSTDHERLLSLNSFTARKVESALRGEDSEDESPSNKVVTSAPAAKKGPGRPKKAVEIDEDETDDDEMEEEAPKRRGRPPGSKNTAKAAPAKKGRKVVEEDEEEDLDSLMDSDDEDEEESEDEESEEDDSDEDDSEDEEEEPEPVRRKVVSKSKRR